MPALPLHTAGPYVAAAYIVFVALILLYVAIMAAKLSRIERELGELVELASGNRGSAGTGHTSSERDTQRFHQSPACSRWPLHRGAGCLRR